MDEGNLQIDRNPDADASNSLHECTDLWQLSLSFAYDLSYHRKLLPVILVYWHVAKVIVSPSQTDMMEQQILSFCGQQRTWLQLELAAEDEKDLEEARSQVLHNLQVSDICVGLYGRTVLRLITPLAPSSATAAFLPVHRFTTGDEVEVRSNMPSNNNTVGGVICEVCNDSISVALFSKDRGCDDVHEALTPPLTMLAKSSIEVHKKLMAALDELEREGVDHKHGKIVRALFEELPQNFNISPLPNLVPINAKLDASQVEAISFCLSEAYPVALVHGPPGTGKFPSLSIGIVNGTNSFCNR